MLLCVQITYDVMDVDAPGFEADFHTFREVVRELEHRLGALIMQVSGMRPVQLQVDVGGCMCASCGCDVLDCWLALTSLLPYLTR